MDEKILDIMRNFVEQVNVINKRMVIAIIAVVACLCVFMSIAVGFYFTADYEYGIVSQYQDSGAEQEQTIITGVNDNG